MDKGDATTVRLLFPPLSLPLNGMGAAVLRHPAEALSAPVSGTVLGNDQILCGNVASTYYLVTPMKDPTPLADRNPLRHLHCIQRFAVGNSALSWEGTGQRFLTGEVVLPDGERQQGSPFESSIDQA